MFENTRIDQIFCNDIHRLADAMERIAIAMGAPKRTSKPADSQPPAPATASPEKA